MSSALLCDHAEAAEGKLFINGAGINVLWVQPQPPHTVSFSVGAIVHVPYTATNQAHVITVTVFDEDGQPVVPWVPDGAPDSPPPVKIEGQFNVGRPPMLPVGESQTLPFAFNLQGVPLPGLGMFSVTIDLDGTEMRRLPFRLMVPQ